MQLLKIFDPVTNGLRHKINIKKFLFSKNNRILRNGIKGFQQNKGRSKKTGHITNWHKGGGRKKIFRKINFENKGYNSLTVIVMYDPFRKTLLNLNFDLERHRFFRTLNIESLFPGTLTSCNYNPKNLMLGYRSKLLEIPIGTVISSISSNKAKTQFVRSAGTFGIVIQKDFHNVLIKLPSNKFLKLNVNHSFATLGKNSNSEQKFIKLGKAGSSRLIGKRPITRGVAMNPCDHPHGGRTSGGRHSVSPWGLPTKTGYKKKEKKNIKNKNV
jgi:large subunit ribosomal protein L2